MVAPLLPKQKVSVRNRYASPLGGIHTKAPFVKPLAREVGCALCVRATSGCSPDGRALDLGSRGRVFDSPHSDQYTGADGVPPIIFLPGRRLAQAGRLPSGICSVSSVDRATDL